MRWCSVARKGLGKGSGGVGGGRRRKKGGGRGELAILVAVDLVHMYLVLSHLLLVAAGCFRIHTEDAYFVGRGNCCVQMAGGMGGEAPRSSCMDEAGSMSHCARWLV